MSELTVSSAVFLPSTCPAGLLADTCSFYSSDHQPFALCGVCSLASPLNWESVWKHSGLHVSLAYTLPTTHSCLPPSTNMIATKPSTAFHGSTNFLPSSTLGLHLCHHLGALKGAPEGAASQRAQGHREQLNRSPLTRVTCCSVLRCSESLPLQIPLRVLC